MGGRIVLEGPFKFSFAIYLVQYKRGKEMKTQRNLMQKIYRTLQATTITVNEAPVMQVLRNSKR